MAREQTVKGSHRSLELAERHRAALERDNPGSRVTFSRRDAAGRFSQHGQNFTFKIIGEKEVDSLEEFWDELDDADDFDYDEYDGGPDYGETAN